MQKIIGNTILELAREKKVNNRLKREVVKRIEKHNTITPWVDDVINDGNFHFKIDGNKIMPISQFFDGCLLTDKLNDASLSMIAGDSEVTAQGAHDEIGYSGINSKRGTYNNIESGIITGGIRQVWDWGTAYGNGTIASVCLTRSRLGAVHMIPDDTVPEAVNYANDPLSTTNTSAASGMWGVFVFDNDGRHGYRVYYEDDSIKVQVYEINNRVLIIRGGAGSVVAVGEPHVINETVTYNRASVSYTGDKLHVIDANGATLKICSITIADWTYTSNTYTFAGISFVGMAGADAREGMMKDIYLITGNYIWGIATVSSVAKLVKCNLTNVADVTAYDIPSDVRTDIGNYQGCFVLLPNGDFYKLKAYHGGANSDYALYFHNGRLYKTFFEKTWIHGHSGQRAAGLNVIKGTTTYQTFGWEAGNRLIFLSAMYPYVSTVNNLEEAVTKSADLTMKLQYEITIGESA